MKYTVEDVIKSANLLRDYCDCFKDCNKECVFFVSEESGCAICDPTLVSCNHWDIPELRKEPGKKIIPFDFSKKEDRDAIKGKYLIRKHSGNPDDEFMVVGFSLNAACFPKDIVDVGNNVLDHYGTGEELFRQFSFQNGKPVGKEVGA